MFQRSLQETDSLVHLEFLMPLSFSFSVTWFQETDKFHFKFVDICYIIFINPIKIFFSSFNRIWNWQPLPFFLSFFPSFSLSFLLSRHWYWRSWYFDSLGLGILLKIAMSSSTFNVWFCCGDCGDNLFSFNGLIKVYTYFSHSLSTYTCA